jgi:hypothetical protein
MFGTLLYMIDPSLDALSAEIEAITPAERIARLGQIEATLRRLEAEAALLVREIERDGAFKADGHGSVAGFLRGELRWSPHQVTRRRQLAALSVELPPVIEHLVAGSIGVAQAHAFAKAGANARCGGQLVDHAEMLLGFARSLPFDHFKIAIDRWERLADADGANRDAESCHENRRFDVAFFDGVGRVSGQCGALDHAEFEAIFEQYRHAEWLADWEWAKQQYGDDIAGSMLPRSNSQRSWDAVMRIMRDAVSTPEGAQPPEPVVNIVCSVTHVEEQLVRAGIVPEEGMTAEPPLAEQPFDEWRCETTDGVPLSPFEVMQAMLHGRIRRVVFGSDGVVLDYGRLQRLFDGAARRAVLLQFPTCVFPGCNRPASECHADHLTDWQHGGATDQRNGAPLCPRHNQLKNRGFTVWRDPGGIFRTYRPDGTEVAPPTPPPAHPPPALHDAA